MYVVSEAVRYGLRSNYRDSDGLGIGIHMHKGILSLPLVMGHALYYFQETCPAVMLNLYSHVDTVI